MFFHWAVFDQTPEVIGVHSLEIDNACYLILRKINDRVNRPAVVASLAHNPTFDSDEYDHALLMQFPQSELPFQMPEVSVKEIATRSRIRRPHPTRLWQRLEEIDLT